MLKALDENPERCGYNETQIIYGLQALEKQSVKQIGSDASQLYYMMLGKDLIKRNDFTLKVAKEHAEITKLRFDTNRSNLEDMPNYIRKPLFDILSKYSDGAVKRINNKWIDITVDDDFLNEVKYKFDDTIM